MNNLERLKIAFEKAFPHHDFKWTKTPNGYRGLCPFHDDHDPSFNIFAGRDGRARFKCFACEKKGELSDVLLLLQGLTPEEIGEVGERRNRKRKAKETEKEEREEFEEENGLLILQAEEFLEDAKKELLSLADSLSLYELEEGIDYLKAKAEGASELVKPYWEFLVLLKKVKFKEISPFSPELPKGKERIKNAINYFNLGIITEKVLEKLTGKVELKEKLKRYQIDRRIGSFVFPYYSSSGKLVSLKFRRPSLSSRDSRVLKLRGEVGYFGIKKIDATECRKRLCSLFVFEGETDALSVFLETQMQTIAVGGVSQLKNLLWDKFFKPFFLIYFPDYDPFTLFSKGAGREAIIALKEEQERVERATEERREIFVYCDERGYEGGKDYCDGSITFRELLSSKKILPLKKAVVEIESQHREFLFKNALAYKKSLEEKGFDGLGQNILEFFEFNEKIPLPKKSTDLREDYDFSPLLGIYPQNKISLIAGAGGTGKTLRVLDLCARIAISEGKRCLFWSTEHTEEELNAMFLKILDNCYLKDYEEIAREKVFFIGQPAEPAVDSRAEKINPEFFVSLEWLLRDYDVVFLDPLLSFYGANENTQHLIRQFLEEVNYVLKRFEDNGEKKYLFFLHHTNKRSGDEFKVYIEDYEHTKTKNEFGRESIFIPPEKTESLRLRIRGGGALLDTVRLVEFLTIAVNKPKKKREGEKEEEISHKVFERISVIVKANFPSGGFLGQGEVIPDYFKECAGVEKAVKEETKEDEEEGWYNEEDELGLDLGDF